MDRDSLLTWNGQSQTSTQPPTCIAVCRTVGFAAAGFAFSREVEYRP
jgi:hypothetical protein